MSSVSIQKSSAPLRSVPEPDEFPDVRLSASYRETIKNYARLWATYMNVDELMYFAAALEHEARKKREGVS